MEMIGITLTLITALLHLYFWILEMFYWTTPLGLRTFGLSKEAAQSSQLLAANQGLYNALLASGLILSFLITEPTAGLAIRRYCLGYIVIVGSYGAYSLNKPKVFLIQTLPALIALLTT